MKHRYWTDGRAHSGMRSAFAASFLVTACSSRQPQQATAVDCNVEAQYGGMNVIENYDTFWPGNGWYGYGDTTPGSSVTGRADGGAPTYRDGGLVWTAAIEEGGLCGTKNAMPVQSHGCQDYGSGFGTYNFGNLQQGTCGNDAGTMDCMIDAGAYSGIRFWARSLDLRPEAVSPYDTTATVTLTINDRTSYGGGYGSVCTVYNAPDGGLGATGNLPVTNPGQSTLPTGSGVGSLVLPADACGNGFIYPLVTTHQWEFYTIPFTAFRQLPRPNRVPTGFDAYSFFQFLIIVPKEARLELWIANLGFYGAKE
jgi:hypothetical protein